MLRSIRDVRNCSTPYSKNVLVYFSIIGRGYVSQQGKDDCLLFLIGNFYGNNVQNLLFGTFEVFTAVTMKNAVFWDVAPCRSCVNRRLGETYRLHMQGRKIRKRATNVSRWLQSACGFFYPEDGGYTFLRNVGSHKIYTAPNPRKRHSSQFFLFPIYRIVLH
jgi:hypothetical protein